MTNEIHLLPEHVIDQIKAGEVVENPSALLKELIENSIDANSTDIEVNIDSDFLNYISPDTSRYEFNTKEMARKVHQEIESAVRGDSIRNHRVLVLPEFHEGKTLKSIGTNL